MIRAASHACMDNIKDIRTHTVGHPYGDLWHLAQLIRGIATFSLGILSILFIKFYTYNGIIELLGYLVVTFVAIIGIKVGIWNRIYYSKDLQQKFLQWDKSNFIDFGPKWFQKFWGFHW